MHVPCRALLLSAVETNLHGELLHVAEENYLTSATEHYFTHGYSYISQGYTGINYKTVRHYTTDVYRLARPTTTEQYTWLHLFTEVSKVEKEPIIAHSPF